MSSLDQQIAQKENELAQLKQKLDEQNAAKKSIVAECVLSHAKSNANFANQLLNLLNENVKRDSDKKRIASVLSDLKAIVSKHTTLTHQTLQNAPQGLNN